MKKRVLILLIASIFAIALTGCQKKSRTTDTFPLSYSYYVWANESSHEITLTLDGPHNRDLTFENIVLAPGEKHEEMIIGMASVTPPGGGGSWFMTVLFDDGTYGVVYEYSGTMLPPEHYNPDYNPTLVENYKEEEVENPEGCSKCTGRRWTYTFTDEDYDAAVAYGPRSQQ